MIWPRGIGRSGNSGSTTTKFVLLDWDGNLIDSFYSNNKGDPLIVARDALIQMRDRYREAGAELEILGAGTTGYGELLFNRAFRTEHHVVETVAHARAADDYVRDASFILDIGGQDMKAIWLDGGIITNIVVNEACSSGCGSFLENFAANLGISVYDIAEAAFSSADPAVLGSRCTVFMNSSIITEQRNGREAGDIMAYLAGIGKPIGDRDALIAAHARSLSVTLVTHNTDEFSRVRGLNIEDWLDS